MKEIIRTLLIFIYLNISICSNAQIENLIFINNTNKNEYKQDINLDLIYNYDQISNSQLHIDILYKNYVAKWLDIQAGIRSTTNSNYALMTKANFKWNIKSHHVLEFINQYQYNIFGKYNSQTLNILFAIAYSQNYCNITLGTNSNFIFPIFDTTSNIIEPILLCYDIEGRIFPKKHHWNITLQVTNISPFITERPYFPNIILKGCVKILETQRERIDLILKLGTEPAGKFYLNSQWNTFLFSTGLNCLL